MKCELPIEKLIGYLYDEVDAEGKAGIESHISTCPACAQALERLGRTRNLMRAWADEVPPASLVFVPEKDPWWKAILRRRTAAGSRRWVAPGVSLGMAAVILVFAVLNFEARYDGEGGLHVKLRLPAVEDLEPSEGNRETPVTRAELIQVQHQSLELIQELIDDGYTRQRLELGLILEQFARDLESQRRRDLVLVGQGLQEIEGSTENRFMRTEDLLHHLLAMTYAQADPYTPPTTE